MRDGPPPEPASPPIGVLIVDDYAPNLTALRALLSPIATVTVAGSGASALEEITRGDYAVVVLDVQMPYMDGIQVARRIRSGSSNAQVPIIFLTAMDSDDTRVLDGYAAGAVDYLRRPFDPIILKSKVSIFVELHERREQARREAAERALLEARRAAAENASREKDQFLSVLTHELRTPLTSILLWSEMLLHKNLPPETVRRGIKMVDLCARHEAHMVDNVLEMSRLVTGAMSLEKELVDLDELVTGTADDIAGMAAERGVQIAWPAPARNPYISADRLRLRRVLYNLVENAIKFTPTGGSVDVSLEEEGASTIRIQVTDTGVGFSSDVGHRLFSRFKQGNSSSTRLQGGLGLGLSLASALIEMHGGAIAAASEGEGRGASFTVTLPRALPGSPTAGP